MTTPFRLLACVAALSALPSYLRAQDTIGRHDRREPQLVLNTPGRTAPCDVLTFTPDGRHVLAAGDDKVVRVWPFRGGRIVAEEARYLRWETYKSNRGAIYAVAVSSDGTKVAVGGAGAGVDTRSGHVVVLDVATGDVVAALPKSSRGKFPGDVWSLAFGQDGKSVLVGNEFGVVWAWDFAAKKAAGDETRLVGRHAAPPAGGRNYVRWIGFRDEAPASMAQDGVLMNWDGSAGGKVVHNFRPAAEIRRVAAGPKGEMAAVMFGRNEVLYRTEAGAAKVLLLPRNHTAESVAFAGGRLLAGSWKPTPGLDFHAILNGYVHSFDLAKANPEPESFCERAFRPEVIGASRDGEFVAVAGGTHHEVALFDADGKERGSVAGPGRCVYQVRFDGAGSIRVCTDRAAAPPSPNARGDGDGLAFDLRRRNWSPPGRAVELAETMAGYSVRFSRTDARDWFLVDAAGNESRIPIDPALYHYPTCYTFLRGPAGQARLAVGHYLGFSLFDATAAGPKLVRVYIGHDDEVLSLAPSADGRRLLTGSRDQTVAAWSADEWPSGSEFGLRFLVSGKTITVTGVDPGSPAWEAGVRRDDEILCVGVENSPTDKVRYELRDESDEITADNPAGVAFAKAVLANFPKRVSDENAVTAYLKRPTPRKTTYFLVRRKEGGKSIIPPAGQEILTTLPNRPLWKFFAAFEKDGSREWAMWMPHSYEYDCSTAGDRYIGFSVNGDTSAEAPTFYPAARFRDRLHKPAAVRRGLDRFGEADAVPSLLEILPPKLLLTFTSGDTVGGTGLDLYLALEERGQAPALRAGSPSLWVNDRKVEDLDLKTFTRDARNPLRWTKTVNLPASEFASGPNRVTFQCENKTASGRAMVPKDVTNPAAPKGKPRLFVLAVGVSDYVAVSNRNGRNYRDLDYCVRDAEAIGEAWQAQEGKAFSKVEVKVLIDRRANRAAILAVLKKFADAAGPDDRVVVYLSGHGYAVPEAVKGPPVYRPGTYSYVTSSFLEANVAGTGLPARALAGELAKIKGRKLVIVDTCHSAGASTEADPSRDLMPQGVGPVILSAANLDQSAFEVGGLRHGILTAALLKAFADPASAVRKGAASKAVHDDDLRDFLAREVPALLRAHKVPMQTPTFSFPAGQRPLPWIE